MKVYPGYLQLLVFKLTRQTLKRSATGFWTIRLVAFVLQELPTALRAKNRLDWRCCWRTSRSGSIPSRCWTDVKGSSVQAFRFMVLVTCDRSIFPGLSWFPSASRRSRCAFCKGWENNGNEILQWQKRTASCNTEEIKVKNVQFVQLEDSWSTVRENSWYEQQCKHKLKKISNRNNRLSTLAVRLCHHAQVKQISNIMSCLRTR